MKKEKLIFAGIIVLLLISNIYFIMENNRIVDEHNNQVDSAFDWEKENLEINENNINEIERCEKENHKLTDDYNDLAEENKKNIDDYNSLLEKYNSLYAEYEKFF